MPSSCNQKDANGKGSFTGAHALSIQHMHTACAVMGTRMVGHTGGQLEPFSMGKMYRGCLCHSFAKNAGISFSWSMLDYSQCALKNCFVGWHPGTTIQQQHHLALASTILHRPLYSNIAAVGGQFTDFYGFFLYVQWVYIAILDVFSISCGHGIR